MSALDGRCSYHYDPIDRPAPAEEFDLSDSELTGCPHPSANRTDGRCLFHSTTHEYPPETITDEIHAVLRDADRDPIFCGGRLGSLDLSGQTITTASGAPIDLRGVTIDGDLDLTDSTVEVPLLLGQAAITGSFTASDARFEGPVDLSHASLGSSLHVDDATFAAGATLTGAEVGFVDARGLAVEGPWVFDDASVTANANFSRARFGSATSFDAAEFDRLIDFTNVDAVEDVSFVDASVGNEATFVAASIGGSFTLRGSEVGGALDCHSSLVAGGVDAADVVIRGEADFTDLRVRGDRFSLDSATVGGRADFAFVDWDTEETTIEGADFGGEVWFTHSECSGDVSLSESQFESTVHLRDAEFGGDLTLRAVTFGAQAYLHGSTVAGSVDASDLDCEHFQFSATVAGDVDLSDARFDARAHFKNSQVDGDTILDGASFAGTPDFSDSIFKGDVSLVDTEFLVEPTFDGTRFAIVPDLGQARFPHGASHGIEDFQETIVVARSEDLLNHGFDVPSEAVTQTPTVPAMAAALIEPDAAQSRATTEALRTLDGREWYDLFRRTFELSRTAASALEGVEHLRLVYGISVTADADSSSVSVDTATLVGVYGQRRSDDRIEFGYLDPDLSAVDELVVVPGDDSAFRADPSVATRGEFTEAILRRQFLQTALLERDGEGDVHGVVASRLPVLVGAARVGSSE